MERVRDDGPDRRAGAIRIELWLDGSMPAGVATGPDGAARDFIGWVGLMSAVDEIVAAEGAQRVEGESGQPPTSEPL